MREKTIFLMVDDDEDDRELFAELLGEINPSIEVWAAANGLEAVQMLDGVASHPPDLLFLDVNMPEMDGKEFLGWLKGNARLRHIPVIVFSTSSQQRDIQEMLKNGAICFITKPANVQEIKAVLSSLAIGFPANLQKGLEQLKRFSFVACG